VRLQRYEFVSFIIGPVCLKHHHNPDNAQTSPNLRRLPALPEFADSVESRHGLADIRLGLHTADLFGSS
jgi:hypothetical protein